MSVLSDKHIKKLLNEEHIVISPYDEKSIQPASVDLHLGSEIKDINGVLLSELNEHEEYVLKPFEFVLGSTSEWIEIPEDLVASVEGRSSVGRLGVTVHITAGWIDPGFRGNITLEIINISDKNFILKNNMSICQLVFQTLSSECDVPYGSKSLKSKYQNSEGTIISRYEEL